MSLDPRAIFLLAVVAVALQVFLALLTQPGWRKFFRNLLWPEIDDPSVIVFHYTCWIGVIVTTLVLVHVDTLKVPGAAEDAARVNWVSLVEYVRAARKTVTSGLVELATLWISGFLLSNFLTVVMLNLYPFFKAQTARPSNVVTLIPEAQFNGVQENLRIALSDIQRTRSSVHNVHEELRFLYRRLKDAGATSPDIEAETVLRSAQVLDELEGIASRPPMNDVNLILSVDSELPNLLPPKIATILFSQLQVHWAERDTDNHVVRIGKGKIGRSPAYFESSPSDAAGAALDKLLGEAISACLNELAKNHALNAFSASRELPNEIGYPRAVRVLVGDEASLINTASDFAGLDCAFPSFTKPQVLNLWIPKSTGEVLFQVAENVEQGVQQADFITFQAKWKKPVMDFLASRGVHANEQTVFSHAGRFKTGAWHSLDCLQIGLRLLQVGYDQPPIVARRATDPDEARRRILIFCAGLLPIILAALHYRKVLCFPDIMRYIRSHCDGLVGPEIDAKKRALLKQLDEFQRTGTFNPL